MEKRTYKRVKAIVAARFLNGNSYYSSGLGTIMNISENGMRIEACKCLPSNTEAKLIVYGRNKVLSVPIKVKRVIKNNGFYDAMGIEVLNPPKDYQEFVHALKSA